MTDPATDAEVAEITALGKSVRAMRDAHLDRGDAGWDEQLWQRYVLLLQDREPALLSRIAAIDAARVADGARIAELEAQRDAEKWLRYNNADKLLEANIQVDRLSTERNTLRADLAAAQVMVAELADDLEAELKSRYDGSMEYASERRKFERDMDPICRARALLPARATTEGRDG